MFVSSTRFNKLRAEYNDLLLKNVHLTLDLNTIRGEWDTLVTRSNEKGGENFLRNGRIGAVELPPYVIKELLFLCHPDKHGGSVRAEEMTKRLLSMRG